MNIANKLTISRLVLVFFLIVLLALPYHSFDLNIPTYSGVNLIYLIALVLFLIASFTDYLDGHLARKYNLITDFGKFLDPIADKVLIDVSLLFLMITPSWISGHQLIVHPVIVIGFILRDLLVDGMRLIAIGKNKVVAANIFGKMKTVAQMVAITCFFLNDWPFSLWINLPKYLTISDFLMYIALALSLLSGVIYLYENRKVFN